MTFLYLFDVVYIIVTKCNKEAVQYEKVTNLDTTPVTTNSGTYAKVMPNIVPFDNYLRNKKELNIIKMNI